MTEEKYIKWSDLIAFIRQHVIPGLYAENFIKLLETIPAADVEPKKKWIPVTEGLPENFVEALVTDGEDVGIAALQGFMDDEVVWCNAYGMDYIDDPDNEDYLPITHWMPIPEPPKGE